MPTCNLAHYHTRKKFAGKALGWESAQASIQESHALELDWALSWEFNWWTLSKFLHSVLPFLESVKVASCRVVYKFPHSRCCWSLVTTPCRSSLTHFQNFFFPLSRPVALVCYSCPGLGVSSAGPWQSTVKGNNNCR
jgi:hypothetical protein